MSLTIACATLTAQSLKAPSQTSIGWSHSASETVVNDFALTDQNGRPFHLSQLRGKAVLLSLATHIARTPVQRQWRSFLESTSCLDRMLNGL
jgi:cytochrome oxidase Cu insertion factor (SCO1/SenC/PrrC family)